MTVEEYEKAKDLLQEIENLKASKKRIEDTILAIKDRPDRYNAWFSLSDCDRSEDVIHTGVPMDIGVALMRKSLSFISEKLSSKEAEFEKL